jgi:hypothetical protein
MAALNLVLRTVLVTESLISRRRSDLRPLCNGAAALNFKRNQQE